MSTQVDVVVPYYNQYLYLSDCLASVYAQTYPIWRLILVDDASNQPCDTIVDSFQDGRITFVRHSTNRGLATARNTGVKISTAEWILPLDADDILSPFFLEKVMRVIQNDPQTDVIFTNHILFGDINAIKERHVQSIDELLVQQSLPGSGTMFQRRLWKAIGGYCEHPILKSGNEDWDYWLSAYEIGINPVHLAEPLYFYRKHKNSMVSDMQFVDYKTRLYMYIRHHRLYCQYHKGREFLSKGFENSAVAYSKHGQRLPTLLLAVVGLFFGRRLTRFLKLVFWGLGRNLV